ncbi:MAG TPA: SGNH/GDSL hydrolase family protein [Xanthobacteraceae bacterium]
MTRHRGHQGQRAGLLAFASLIVVAFSSTGGTAVAQEPTRTCKAPSDLIRLTQPLTHTARRLANHQPLTIVAIGSSSTAGAGASSPAASYPSRLAAELKERFPGYRITVINRGVNGEEAHDMLARFASGVISEKPDLVLWQVGTNSVLRDQPIAPISPIILEGVRELKDIGADVVMIDPQFTPQVVAKPQIDTMVKLISASAKEANVDLFQRFATMRYWHDAQQIPFAAIAAPDQLHMNDWSYGCFAKLLGAAIADAATRGVASAQALPAQSAIP